MGAWICTRCRKQIEAINPPLCVHCGRGVERGAVCYLCRSHRPALDGLRAAAYFGGSLREAIHAFKYNGVRALAGPLGEILYDGYLRHAIHADVLVPVPLHDARHSQRGFNQSLLLAQELARRSGLAVGQAGLLRTRDTRSQVGLGAAERRANVHEAFAWQGGSLASRRVLLIDDVCTTGATMEACAAPLYLAGALSVWGLTLAREK
jgi:ComF family protein